MAQEDITEHVAVAENTAIPAGHPLRQSRVETPISEFVQAARDEETRVSHLQRMVGHALDRFTEWLRPAAPGATPIPTELAQALTERTQLHTLLNYRDFDTQSNLMYLTSADTFRVGFMLSFAPLLVAGTDIESQLEAILTNCPPETVVQIGVLGSGQVQQGMDDWLTARLCDNHHPVLSEIALRRAEFFNGAAGNNGNLLFSGNSFQPKKYFYYLSLTQPYEGNPADAFAMEVFLKNLVGLRATVEGTLKGASIPSRQVDKEQMEFLMVELLNQQLTPKQRKDMVNSGMPLPESYIDTESRVRVLPEGTLHFSSMKDGASDVVASILTMDAPPVEGWLPNTAKLLGHPLSREDRINCPFWLHTTMHVQNPEKSKDRITMKLGTLNKQMMSDSQWYRSMMGHLYTQKGELDSLLEASRYGHSPVRVWSGITLYNSPDRVKRDTEYVANLWRKAGFRCSQERYITLPVFLASMPLMYNPAMDPPGRGLQRANTVNSFNAATLMHVQGDWSGSAPNRGGPLLISRRGQLASIDLFDTSSNYNFVVIAQSGSGKSFFSNELAVDFLSRNGVVRIFDVGRSYKRFASVMGGTVLEFSPENPVSLNPFYGIETVEALFELMPMMKSLIRQMVFPLSTDESMETSYNWEYTAIEKAIEMAWMEHRTNTGLVHVYDWLDAQEDKRYKDLAFQLYPYAAGRYSKWFNGPRQVEMNNDLVIIELEDLEVDPDLQAVVLTLMIHQITKDMYLSDPERKRPKLLLVDEGWRLLGDKQSGGFISKAFRTVRKYRGCAGAITQSYADFAASAAARAALENSAWQFVLRQKGESIDFAVNQKWIADDEMLVKMLKSVVSDTTQGFSEVFVRGEHGSGVYRFVTDRHSYWLYTTHPADLARLADVQRDKGLDLLGAVDYLARQDYTLRGHPHRPEEGSLLNKMFEAQAARAEAEILD